MLYTASIESKLVRSQEPYEVTGRSYDTGVTSDGWQVMGESCTAKSETVPRDDFVPRWYAVSTRSRHEKSVGDLLQRKRIETFLPLYEAIHRWRNGDHCMQLPLFPGYAFVRVALRDRLEVLKVPGVVRLVGFNGIPTPLEDAEVESLRLALAAGVKASPHPYLTAGQRVRITAGPLAGHEGVLIRKKRDFRVVLSIDLLQRSVLVSVDAAWLEPA